MSFLDEQSRSNMYIVGALSVFARHHMSLCPRIDNRLTVDALVVIILRPAYAGVQHLKRDQIIIGDDLPIGPQGVKEDDTCIPVGISTVLLMRAEEHGSRADETEA